MAQASVKTVQYLDPRIEPQPDPVYDYVVAPTQNQYYKIPASGKSNSSLTFNNLTTLGIDRAYLDTFELELGVTITFQLNHIIEAVDDEEPTGYMNLTPPPFSWTFDSFPFNKCCDEARVNINGGAFFSQPMCYVRAKERYMNQWELSKCYENCCPCHRAVSQTESTREYSTDKTLTSAQASSMHLSSNYGCRPTRLGIGMSGFMQSAENNIGGFNNAIVQLGKPFVDGGSQMGYENYYIDPDDNTRVIVKVQWREPLFVSPFSSRYDATYGRPLYNITSMDFSFTMQNLGNMIRVVNFNNPTTDPIVTSYSINIDSAQLCYQVMTIPPVLNKPLVTLVPYRRFVPYITDYTQSRATGASSTSIPTEGYDKVEITSGVYTLNEMPTAIWVFCAPVKADYQDNKQDSVTVVGHGESVMSTGNWDTNRLFGYLKKINISMANTTQILATADVPDLYRIAKANGCEDSYWSWAQYDTVNPVYAGTLKGTGPNEGQYNCPTRMYLGAGSVLRLKPGVDLIVPDQALIPGANANNMVFQCTAEFYIPPHSINHDKYALWLLFEYVGVAAISPGQCEITMNPLGSGEIMTVSPVMSATSESTEGQLEGSGFWDKVKRAAAIAGQLADDGIISMILKRIPKAAGAAEWLGKHGFGEPASKRTRGGACPGSGVVGSGVMGKGLNDWV